MKTNITVAIALIVVLAANVQAAEPTSAEARAKAVAPFIDEQTVVVAYVDVARFQIDPLIDKVASLIPDLDNVRGIAKTMSGGILNQLRQAGGNEIYVVFSLADFSPQREYLPRVIIPLAKDSNEQQLKDVLNVLQLPKQKRIVDLLVASSQATLDRVAQMKADPRSDLLPAFEATNNSVVQILVLPPAYGRRIIEEMSPKLPAELGGGSVSSLTRGIRWVALSFNPPSPTSLRLTMQLADGTTATSCRDLFDRAVKGFDKSGDIRKLLPNVDEIVKLVTPQVHGDQLRIVIDDQNTGNDAIATVVSMFQPGIANVRQSAQRVTSMNNLRQIALAMHTYHDVSNSFPAFASFDAAGKPLLSWRVHVLPYLGEDALYKQFKLAEPWDSENNKKLIGKMPKFYRSPLAKGTDATKSHYVVPVGEGTVFFGREGIKMTDIPDGTSNTILALEVDDAHAVVWTKPEDLSLNFDKLKTGLDSGPLSEGFLAAYCDGSVRLIPKSIEDSTLRLLLLRADGKVVPNF